jgi:DNA-binding LytR/AlgR family response regulator
MATLLKYILADDDPVYLELMLQYLKLIPNCECLASCSNAIETGAQMQQRFPDLLILDVEMPGLSGLQFAQSLSRLPLIIFISSHRSYAADAFEVDAVDFIVKPLMPERLIRAVEKSRALLEMKKSIREEEGFKLSGDLSFFIKDKNAFVKIYYNDVLYIESLGDFVNIFLQNGDKKIALVSMKSIELQLPDMHFIRISRTHMVNKQKITSIETNTLMLDKIQLVIGKSYNATVLQAVIGNKAVRRFI